MATFDAIVCFYHRERDADWLHPFLTTLRAVGYGGDVAVALVPWMPLNAQWSSGTAAWHTRSKPVTV